MRSRVGPKSLALKVQPCTRATVDQMVQQHYLGRWPGVVVLTLSLCSSDTPLGVLVFALPPKQTNIRYGCRVWELARLWCDDSLPRNTETWFIARALRLLIRENKPVDLVVSYADPSVGHQGVIYRAANFILDGRTDEDRKTPRFDYRDSITGKHYSRRGHIPEGTVVEHVPRVSKARYVYDLRPARNRRRQRLPNV